MVPRWFTLAVVLTVALAPLALAQDAPGPITWVGLDKTKSGMSEKLIGMTIQSDGPMYDELLANGTLISWGIAIPIQHRLDDDFNYFQWATMADWGKVGELQAGFEKLFASRSPEAMKAMQEAYREAVVGGAHHDWIVRQLVYEQGSAGSPPRYLHMSYYQALPGSYDAVTDFYVKNVKPIYAQLLADGVITSYGMATQELHGEKGWTHVGWYSSAELGARDAVGRAIQTSLSAEQLGEVYSMMDMASHSDQVLMIVHLGGATPEP